MQPLQLSVRRAWQAASRMQDAMAEFATLETSVGSVALGMKIGIGSGDVLGLSVGGERKRWQAAWMYALSKRTELQAFYDNDGIDSSRSNVRVKALGAGIKHVF